MLFIDFASAEGQRCVLNHTAHLLRQLMFHGVIDLQVDLLLLKLVLLNGCFLVKLRLLLHGSLHLLHALFQSVYDSLKLKFGLTLTVRISLLEFLLNLCNSVLHLRRLLWFHLGRLLNFRRCWSFFLFFWLFLLRFRLIEARDRLT